MIKRISVLQNPIEMEPPSIYTIPGTVSFEESNPPIAALRPMSHIHHLDGLRALAAIYVVLHHSVLQLIMPSGPLYSICSKLFSKGHFAVDAFIVISGFCLMIPVVKSKQGALQTRLFFKKRMKRILPTYYLAMAFSLLLIYTLIGTPSGTNWDESLPVSYWDLFTHLTLIQDFFTDSYAKINHAFWSISVEFRIYFLFPALVFLFKKFNPFDLTVAISILSVAAWGALKNLSGINTGLNGVNPHYLGLFAVGMLAAHIAYSSKAILMKIKEASSLLVLTGVLCVVGLVLDSPKLGYWIAADFAIGIACACLLIALQSEHRRGLRTLFGWKPLAFVGSFAYSVYLIHAPLLEVFSRYVVVPFRLSTAAAMLSFLLLATPLIIAISYGFFLLAEKPFMRKKIPDGTH